MCLKQFHYRCKAQTVRSVLLTYNQGLTCNKERRERHLLDSRVDHAELETDDCMQALDGVMLNNNSARVTTPELDFVVLNVNFLSVALDEHPFVCELPTLVFNRLSFFVWGEHFDCILFVSLYLSSSLS